MIGVGLGFYVGSKGYDCASFCGDDSDCNYGCVYGVGLG